MSFDDLSAVYLNCTLKRSPQTSNTQGLIDVSADILRSQGVSIETIRVVDHDVAPGVYPDMTQDGLGFEHDGWPAIWEKVDAAHILVIATPLWLGDKSSVATTVVERLYAHSGDLNDEGQSIFYGKVGGIIVTGNEDGIKHAGMNLTYSMQHLGITIPPQCDAGWVGEAGPGPSYLDEGSGGPENEFTRRNTGIAAWNLMHLARLLTDAGGYPAKGNTRE